MVNPVPIQPSTSRGPSQNESTRLFNTGEDNNYYGSHRSVTSMRVNKPPSVMNQEARSLVFDTSRSNSRNNSGNNSRSNSTHNMTSIIGRRPSNMTLQSFERPIIFPKTLSYRLYLSYYLPILSWLPEYNMNKFWGDLIAGLSLAAFQIPLCMSYASSLAKLSPIVGLYSLIIPGFIYAIFGCVSQMILGPDVAITLILGQISDEVRQDPNQKYSAQEIVSVITGTVSGLILAAGLFRVGFWDNVLSRALLRGFMAAFGVVMLISELISELGLTSYELEEPGLTSTTFDKMKFIHKYFDKIHILTTTISAICFCILLVIKILKKKLTRFKKFKWIIFIPEILITVIITTILSKLLNWEHKGVSIVGSIENSSIKIRFPINFNNLSVFKKRFSTSFIIAILGFFDTCTTIKALGANFNFTVSSNRELVAAGMVNIGCSLFGALPSFGGYAKSKINVLSGAKTPMAGIVLATITLFSVWFLIPLFYYLPECILAVIISIIAISLLEEAPSDILFYWKVSGYQELLTLLITFLVTVIGSAEAGIAIGTGLAIDRVIRHSYKSRIQILGRVPNTNIFRNADELIEEAFNYIDDFNTRPVGSNEHSHGHQELPTINPNIISEIEEIEGCLIVKIPEPLTFVNTEDLKTRLLRLEKYGTLHIHPSQPATRDEKMTRYLILDLKGMTNIDISAVQILFEIIQSYKSRGVYVLFTRIPVNKKIRDVFISSGIVNLIQKKGEDIMNIDTYEPFINEYNVDDENLADSGKQLSDGVSTGDHVNQRRKSHLLTGLGEGFYASIEDALSSIDEEERARALIV